MGSIGHCWDLDHWTAYDSYWQLSCCWSSKYKCKWSLSVPSSPSQSYRDLDRRAPSSHAKHLPDSSGGWASLHLVSWQIYWHCRLCLVYTSGTILVIFWLLWPQFWNHIPYMRVFHRLQVLISLLLQGRQIKSIPKTSEVCAKICSWHVEYSLIWVHCVLSWPGTFSLHALLSFSASYAGWSLGLDTDCCASSTAFGVSSLWAALSWVAKRPHLSASKLHPDKCGWQSQTSFRPYGRARDPSDGAAEPSSLRKGLNRYSLY